MALQSRNLVMVGLGTLGDTPPNNVQPPLVDGIHLRWAFKPELGFPWHGYYLFRRRHRRGRLVRLSRSMGHLQVRRLPQNHLTIHHHGWFTSDGPLILTDDFPPANSVEFDLASRSYLRFTFHATAPVRRVLVRIGFHYPYRIRVRGLLGDVPVVGRSIQGQASQIVTVSLEFDAITAIEISQGPAALVDLSYVPASQDATIGWEAVPDFPYPLRLPVTHPDYPCTSGMEENLPRARDLARQRIRYGSADQYTLALDPIYDNGTISVQHDSSVVIGHGTYWGDYLIGGVFRIDGDPTVFNVIAVVSPDKLVLSRRYPGPERNAVAYVINRKDHFGQLHDYLAHLVAGGSDAGAMVNRSLPLPAYNAGTITVDEDAPDTVTGIGTGWTVDLEGLALQVSRHSAGTIEVEAGSSTVTGTNSNWGDHLAHMTLQIMGEPTLYTIRNVKSPTELELDRKYVGGLGDGDHHYRIYDNTAYTIRGVDAQIQQLRLDRNIPTFHGQRHYLIIGRLQPADSQRAALLMPRQYPLDLVLLASLHPAIAQMVGLYWVDDQVDLGVPYDYLLLAAHFRPAGYTSTPVPTGEQVLAWLNQGRISFDDMDGYIVFNKKMAPARPLPAPTGLQVYALPGSVRTQHDGSVFDASNNAGLCWNLGTTREGILLPDQAILYHLWRANLGLGDEPTPSDSYELITAESPRLVAEPRLPEDKTPQRPPNWPTRPLHAIDSGPIDARSYYQVNGIKVFTGLPDGWYSYQVSGIDIFGRHSPNSEAGAWHQWAPAPDPRPWYFQDPADDRAVHPSAVRLLDKMPPPLPTGIEAFALDPLDPTVLKDAAYNAWHADNEGVVGLRVRWLWTQAHMRQAPDTREFRIYYQPRRLNALLGRVVTVTAFSATESVVEIKDIGKPHPENAYAGTRLQVGSGVFTIVAGEAVSPLCLRVRHSRSLTATGTVSVEENYPTVKGSNTSWRNDLVGKGLQVGKGPQIPDDAVVYTIQRVDGPRLLALDRPYEGATDDSLFYRIIKLPRADAPCTLIFPPDYTAGKIAVRDGSPTVTGTATQWSADLVGRTFKVLGESTEYAIVGVDPDTQHLTLDRGYEGTGGRDNVYLIRHPLFDDYSVPIRWQKRIHVVGYDQHVTEATDDVGRTLRKYEVFLPAPDTGPDESFFPSLAEPVVYAHIGVCAADDKTHTLDDPNRDNGDWGGRFGNEGRIGAPAKIFRVHRQLPEPPIPPPDLEKVYATAADYHGRSYYTYRWQRPKTGLKVHIFRALDDALFNVDWNRHGDTSLTPDNFPIEWRAQEEDDAATIEAKALRRQVVAEKLDELQRLKENGVEKPEAMAYYRGLSNDALRVLAGLPGNERAFTQITIQPLDPDDPANANRLGPDNLPDFPIDDELCIYIDTLDGRSTNRYFYRAAYVDGAHNRSPLSLSSPPVYLPNVVPPRAPVITKVLGGDRQITLKWASNREADLVEYRVYRTDSKDNARELRLMTLVHTEGVPSGDPAARPAEVEWPDKERPGLVTFYYRVVAVDEVGNASAPSASVSARAFDESMPVPPILTVGWIDDSGTLVAQATWTSANETLLQRRKAAGGFWITLGDWLPSGDHIVTDTRVDATLSYEYRLRVRKPTGAAAIGDPILLNTAL